MQVTSSSSHSQTDVRNSHSGGHISQIKGVSQAQGNAQLVIESLKLNTIEQIRKNSNRIHIKKQRQLSCEMDEFDVEKIHSKTIRKKESYEHNGEQATEKTKFTAATCVPDESRQASFSQNHNHSNIMNENSINKVGLKGETQSENNNQCVQHFSFQNTLLNNTFHHLTNPNTQQQFPPGGGSQFAFVDQEYHNNFYSNNGSKLNSNMSQHSIQGAETLNELERRMTNAKYMKSNQTLTTLTTAQNTYQMIYPPQLIPSLSSVSKGSSGRENGGNNNINNTNGQLNKKISYTSLLSKNPSFQGNPTNRELEQELDMKMMNNISQNNIDTNKSSMNLIQSDRYNKSQQLDHSPDINTSSLQPNTNAQQYILNSDSSQHNFQQTMEQIQDSPLPIKKLPSQYQTILYARNHSLSEQHTRPDSAQQNPLIKYQQNNSMKELKVGSNQSNQNGTTNTSEKNNNQAQHHDVHITITSNNNITNFNNVNTNPTNSNSNSSNNNNSNSSNNNANNNIIQKNLHQVQNQNNSNNNINSNNQHQISNNHLNVNSNNINNYLKQLLSNQNNHLHLQHHNSDQNNSSHHHHNSNTLNMSRVMRDFTEFDIKTARSQINLDLNINDEQNSLSSSNKASFHNKNINNLNQQSTQQPRSGPSTNPSMKAMGRMEIENIDQMQFLRGTAANLGVRQPKTTFTTDIESRNKEYMNSFCFHPSMDETKHELDKNRNSINENNILKGNLQGLAISNKLNVGNQSNLTNLEMKRECQIVLNQIDQIDTKYSEKVSQILRKYMKYDKFIKMLIYEAQQPIYNSEIEFKVQFQFKPDSFLKDVVVQEIKKLESNQMLAFAERQIERSSFYRIFQSFYNIFHSLFLKLIIFYIISCVTIFSMYFTNQDTPLWLEILIVLTFFFQITLSIIYNYWRYLQRNNGSQYLFFFLCTAQITFLSIQQVFDQREIDEFFIISTTFRILQILISLILSYYFYQMNKAARLFLLCFKILQE